MNASSANHVHAIAKPGRALLDKLINTAPAAQVTTRN